MPILTTAGVLQGGLITDASRQKFVDDTNALLLNGSGDYLLGSLPDTVIFDGNNFLAESFSVQPLDKHIETFPAWHTTFIDKLFQETANLLDKDGATPISPIMDYTVPVAKFNLPLLDLSLPDFAIGMAIPFPFSLELFFDIDLALPEIQLLLPKIEIPGIALPDLSFPSIGFPAFDFALPQIPGIDIPFPPNIGLTLPSFSLPFNFSFPIPVLGFLTCVIVKTVPTILIALVANVIADGGTGLLEAIAKGPTGLIAFVVAIVLDAVLSCLGINLKNVLTFLAGFLVYIERLAAMLAVVLLGMIFGEGLLVTVAAKALQLT